MQVKAGEIMFEIFSQTDNKIVYASPDSTILEAMHKAKINHTHVCGDNARCTTCRVYIMDGLNNCLPRNEGEMHLANKLGFPEDIRLACQTKISGNITIRRPVVDDLDIEIVLTELRDGKKIVISYQLFTSLRICFWALHIFISQIIAFCVFPIVWGKPSSA